MNFPRLPKFFSRKSKAVLGIDVGTSGVKIVELERAWRTGREGEFLKLNAYGAFTIPSAADSSADSMRRSTLQMLDSEIAEIIHAVIEEAGMTGRAASLSIPVFSSFFTLLELPSMSHKELQEAVPFQARQLVPVPISEVVLDWEVVSRTREQGERKRGSPSEKVLVMAVAVPRDVIDKYVRIAALAKLELGGLEVETFSVVRSVVRDDKIPLLLIDIGARATSLSIIDEGTIRMSHNLDTSGAEITRAVAQGTKIGLRRAEAFKTEYGLTGRGGEEAVTQPMKPILDIIFTEADKLATVYMRKYRKDLQKAVFIGGTANLPGLLAYAQERLGKESGIGQPFVGIEYPPILDPVIKEIGPAFSIAVGLALREFRK